MRWASTLCRRLSTAPTVSHQPYATSLDIVKATAANGGRFPEHWLNLNSGAGSEHATQWPAPPSGPLSGAAAGGSEALHRIFDALADPDAAQGARRFAGGYGPVTCVVLAALATFAWEVHNHPEVRGTHTFLAPAPVHEEGEEPEDPVAARAALRDEHAELLKEYAPEGSRYGGSFQLSGRAPVGD